MKRMIYITITVMITLYGCKTLDVNNKQTVDITPKPQSIEISEGKFTINSETKILYDKKFGNTNNIVTYFNNFLSKSSGIKLTSFGYNNQKSNFIYLKFDSSIKNEEGYHLLSNVEGITISARTSIGIFWGIQSLLQLLPTKIYSQNIVPFSLDVPIVKIIDEPRFKWRGVHLDVGRYFYPKKDIKKYIDYLAMHKMRQFHWHLTEDQGWRIEIKKYPKLTQIGAWRKETAGDGVSHGGFYTQEDIKEIVNYAEKRFITIIPEIEMPGHSQAALAAYPELACTSGPFNVATNWGVHSDVYCAGNEKTFEFLENVLSEVVELFPSKYIHIGGDESPKSRWEKCSKCQLRIKNEHLKDEHELQSYFIQRIENFLHTKNRKIIGWDEILEGGLAPDATVMSWRGIQGGIEAARQNHDVIMTPTSYCYFDYYQGNPENEPVAIGGFLPISKVYSYEPIPEQLSVSESKHILGTQANVWTEYLPKFENVEYMLLPRLSALSEVCWTNKKGKDINDFLKRLSSQFNRYEELGINYAKSSFNVTIGTKLNLNNNALDIELTTEFLGADIYYTLDGSMPNIYSNKYVSPFSINNTLEVKAVSYKNGKLMSAITKKNIAIHKAFGKTVKLTSPYSDKYSAGGKFGLVNGMFGSTSFSAGDWQGFEGTDLEAVIDLEKPTQIHSIESSYMQRTNSWIFMPQYVEYSFSSDGINYSIPSRVNNKVPQTSGEVIIKKFTIHPQEVNARYIKIFAKNIEKCPDWHLGAGGKAWLFVDEIVVN